MSDTDADVVVVGGGIAGLSAAYFAAKAGRAVTVVDEGVHAASTLPVALVNPLRGRAGRLVARGVEGMHATFALVDALAARGHAIEHGRGLHRPLVDRDEKTSSEAYWRARIAAVAGPTLSFTWHADAPASLGLAAAVPSLFLPDAGWIAPHGLLAALKAESRATCIATRATGVDRHGVTIADGTRIAARALIWCGGAWGASQLDGASTADPSSDDARYKPGSLASAPASLTREPLTFGLYAVPRSETTIVGPTRESTMSYFDDAPVAPSAIGHLEDRIAATFGSTIRLQVAWRGVRLARASTAAAAALAGVDTLTALGSRGFLLAPLLAAEWARSL